MSGTWQGSTVWSIFWRSSAAARTQPAVEQKLSDDVVDSFLVVFPSFGCSTSFDRWCWMMPGWYKGEGVVVSFVFCHFLCQISSSVRAAENGTRRRTRRMAEGNIFTSFPTDCLLHFYCLFLGCCLLSLTLPCLHALYRGRVHVTEKDERRRRGNAI